MNPNHISNIQNIANNDRWGHDNDPNKKAKNIGSDMILEEDEKNRYVTVTDKDGKVKIVNQDDKYKIKNGSSGIGKKGKGSGINICGSTGINIIGGNSNVVNQELFDKNKPSMSIVKEQPEMSSSFFFEDRNSAYKPVNGLPKIDEGTF